MTKKKVSLARGVLKDGRVQTVQPQGTELVEGNHYYNPHIHRALLHVTEDVPVVLREPKAVSVGGSSAPAASPHFRLATRKPKSKYTAPREIDHNKGWRIHINTSEFSEDFSELSGIYTVSKRGKLSFSDRDMKDRAPISITGAQDILDLMKKAKPSRLIKSRVVFRNRALAWEDFLIRPQASSGHTRFVDLLTRIETLKKKDEETFCAMVLRLEKPFYYSLKNTKVVGQNLPISRTAKRFYETIVPKAYMNNERDGYLHDAFNKAGDYLVVGIPSVWTREFNGDIVHHLSIKLESREAVARIDWDDILKTDPKPQAAPAPVPALA